MTTRSITPTRTLTPTRLVLALVAAGMLGGAGATFVAGSRAHAAAPAVVATAGTDLLDCKYCPTTDDGVCDEVEEIGGLCPPGTDEADCCAHLKDGVCEELGLGGACPAGSDIWDCGYCPWTGDDQCDEPEGTDLCGEGSDPEDCA